MSTPTTLEEYAQAEVVRLEALETNAHAELGLAQADVGSRKLAFETALGELAKADSDLAAVRKQLGGSEVSADATSGSVELHAKLLAQRAAQAALYLARLAMLGSEDRLTLAKVDLDAIASSLADARVELVEFSERSEQIATWVDAVATGTDLSGLPAAATTELTSPAFAAAKLKIDGTLPLGLRTRASERITAVIVDDQAAADHVATLEAEADDVFATNGGISGQVPATERALNVAEAALGDYVRQAAGWLAEARARVARIAARRTITTAEAAALTAATSAAALAAELAFDQEVAKRAKAQRGLDQRIADLYAADPEPDIDTDSQVIARRTEITNAEAAMTMPSSTAADMKALQAEVPDFAWDDLLDLRFAEHLLTKLAAAVPSTLASTASAAELALVGALQAELDIDRRLEPIDTFIDRASTALARSRMTAEDRRRAATRGLR